MDFPEVNKMALSFGPLCQHYPTAKWTHERLCLAHDEVGNDLVPASMMIKSVYLFYPSFPFQNGKIFKLAPNSFQHFPRLRF